MKRLLLAALLALAACVPQKRIAWVPTQPSFVSPGGGFEVVPPPGWMRLDAPSSPDGLVITRDGIPLQRISVTSGPIGKPLGLGGGKRVVQAGMSPLELAELAVDDMRTAEGVTDVRMIESAPAALSGRGGFRVVTAYRSESGLPRRIALYGVVDGERFYKLSYLAPERVYFARDLPVFEELVRSFRLRPAAAAAASPGAPPPTP
jgi:hypothetical protein